MKRLIVAVVALTALGACHHKHKPAASDAAPAASAAAPVSSSAASVPDSQNPAMNPQVGNGPKGPPKKH